MTLRDIVVAFGYEVDQNSVSKAENTIKGLKSMATKLLGAIGIGFSIAGLSDLAQSAADLEALESQFSQVFNGMEDQATETLKAVADESGALVNRMKGSFTQLAAFTKTTGASEAEALEIAQRGMYAAADSAAFYDRSLEEVTASLRSFLKGNFEQDAALGISATETTRNAAANELYGKSFKELSEYQKQLTLLKMVEDGNKLSGALGQAARESDTWTNQLGNLKQSIKDLKASAGSTFLKPAIAVLKLLTSLVQKATKAIEKMKEENGLLTRATERYHAIVKRMQPAIERMSTGFNKGLAKTKEVIGDVIMKFGGIENVMKIVTALAAGFAVALNWGKIIAGLKSFGSAFTKIFSAAGGKVALIIAIVALLFLLIEDFIHFMLGNDSVMGKMFEKFGISADDARKNVIKAWTKIQDFLLDAWDVIKEMAKVVAIAVKEFYVRHWDDMKKNLIRLWGILKDFLKGVWTFISQLADTLFGKTEDNVEGKQMSTKEKIVDVWKKIVGYLSEIWDEIYSVVSSVFSAVAATIETIFTVIKIFWNKWGKDILKWFKAIFGTLTNVTKAFFKAIKGISKIISSIFKGDWKGVWEGVKMIFESLWETTINTLKAGWETIKLVFKIVGGAIASIWKKLWNSLLDFFKNLWTKILAYFRQKWEEMPAFPKSVIVSIINVCLILRDKLLEIWNNIVDFFREAFDRIVTIFRPVAEFFKGVFQSAWDGIKSVFSSVADFFKGVWDKIVSTFKEIGVAIADAISGAVKAAINKVLTGAVNIINGFIKGINKVIGVLNDIPGVEIVKLKTLDTPQLAEGGIATSETLATIGEGSEPEAVMPLSKLGGMINGYIKMAKESDTGKMISSLIGDVIGPLKTCVQAFTRASSVSAATVSSSTSKTSIVQNVEINNSYSGGDTATQKNVSTAMKKSAVDATTQMARALAYGRG